MLTFEIQIAQGDKGNKAKIEAELLLRVEEDSLQKAAWSQEPVYFYKLAKDFKMHFYGPIGP